VSIDQKHAISDMKTLFRRVAGVFGQWPLTM
jgi:hypothetical protein